MRQIPLYYQQQASAQQKVTLPSINHHNLQQSVIQQNHTSNHQSADSRSLQSQQQGVHLQPILGDNGNNITLPSISHSSSRHGSQTINANHLPPNTHYQPLKPPHQGMPLSNSQGAPSLSLRRGPWSPEEDRKLLDSIHVFGASNWVRISQSLGSRTPKQCRERYHQNLKPSLNRNPITNEEGALIEELVQRHGKRWAEIARHLNGRSDNAIKNWWNGGANRRRRASSQAVLEAKSIHPDEIQPLTSTENSTNSLPPQQQEHQKQRPASLHQYNSSVDSSSNPNMQGYREQTSQQGLPSQDQFQRQLGVKRFLEEQHFPQRRHSTQTIMTSDSFSPVSTFNANGGSSRNSLVSLDYSNNNSRKNSLVFDYPNNSNGAYRKNSITSQQSNVSYLQSPVFGGQRNSIVGGIPNLTPLSPMVTNSTSSQHSTGSTSSQPSLNDNLFKSDFTFNKPNNNNQVKLPGPTSIYSNPIFLQSPRVQSGLRENPESQPPRPLSMTESSEQLANVVKRESQDENNNYGMTHSEPNSGTNNKTDFSIEKHTKLNMEEKQKVMNISNLLG